MSCHQHQPPPDLPHPPVQQLWTPPPPSPSPTITDFVTPKASPVQPTTHSSLGGAGVGPAELPRVRSKNLDGYLRDARDEWEKFRGPTTTTDEETPL
ncbi:hypothetical protein AAF712_015421 [Marasmius tenuissimus]|uniref:Uncharacterized protein n=1 Tax=Marasmius tenuissimus TaxID=585030 RepID=A0ABR2Z8A2_9AGAR